MSTTSWKLDQVTEHYLKQVRGGIPYGADQTKMMLQVISHFQSEPLQVLDLGCGNGFLAKLLLQTFPEARAILVDHSKPMLHNAAQYMAEHQERCTFVEAIWRMTSQPLQSQAPWIALYPGMQFIICPMIEKRNCMPRFLIH
nr:class I SAM-dependent methyltransferase [Shouchella clausii]